ncbi:protein HGV2-like isoform X2 [Paramacrobiotus metropolitanus]|uniref:protein HGV2-like isoform X2 n=1 Tax=Paramacrobiotus metropolitanus TaxID=2943436 RepID=UPI0024464E20|nr:protein HGV2-like isoform X2 [Paramacrobiotus metropolitanus]
MALDEVSSVDPSVTDIEMQSVEKQQPQPVLKTTEPHYAVPGSPSASGSSSAAAEACMPGTSGSASTTDWKRVETARTALETAKALMKVDPVEYERIIDTLDQVCSTLKKELGDFHTETVDALFHYGSILLEYYQMGAGLVSNKAEDAIKQYAAEILEGSKEEEVGLTDENKNPGDEVGEDNGEDDDAQSDDDSVEDDGEALDVSDHLDDEMDTNAESVPEESSTVAAEPICSESVPAETSKKQNEDAIAIGELRYAWEILETARVGYAKRVKETGAFTDKIRLSDIHHKLALCAAENGQQNLALVEAERALKVCEEACQPTDRELAEAYFNYGTTLSMYALLAEAAHNMKTAVSILENRKAMSNARISVLESSTEDKTAEILKLKKEVDEISELVPDLMARVQDIYEDMRLGSDEARKLLNDWLKGVSEQCNSEAGVAVSAAPVSDISHLVRRVKRSSDMVEDDAVKRLKASDPSSSDTAERNGTSDGTN